MRQAEPLLKRGIVRPTHVGLLYAGPVRFFAGLEATHWPRFAVHDLFGALLIPADTWPDIIRIGREAAPEALKSVATHDGIVVTGDYGFGRAMIELCRLKPGFEGTLGEYHDAIRQTAQAMVG